MALEIRLLGPFEVRRRDELLELGGPRPRALLALLCLHRGTVVAVDRIVDELWGERPPKTARHMVEVYVSKIRKLLGADVMTTRPSGYLLGVDPRSIDSVRFGQLLAEGRDALAAGAAAVAASKLAEALSLWRGPALADFAYEPFAQAEIARLEESRLVAEEELTEAELALGKGSELVADLERQVAAAPLRERRSEHLMVALYRAGRQTDALSTYRETREALIEELGIEPGPELRRLERAILAQEDWLAGRTALNHRARVPRETRRLVTVVFAELAGGAAGLDPEALDSVVERALERAKEVFSRHGASVERAPDGTVIAVFGSPVAHEDDAGRTLYAVDELRELGVVARAGIATGEVLAGRGPTVRGPAVRTAAELLANAATKEVLTDELTRRLAEGRPLLLDTPIVGRQTELATLHDALARATLERRPQLVTVVGEPGIGKSRLAREFRNAPEGAARVLVGRCPAYGEGITYWPLREVIRELAPDEALLALQELVAGLPDGEGVARRMAAAAGVLDEVHPVEEIRRAARRLFEELARGRPLVLVFEDIHWAEPSFLDLLEHVIEVGGDAPIFVLCLARPELLEARPAWAELGSLLTVDALSDTEAEELVERRDPAGVLPSQRRARILAAAEGNPLFLEQLVAYTAEPAPHGNDPAVPPTLQALLAARIDLLGPAERSVLECAAVVGREFSADAVGEIAPPEALTALARHLDALRAKALLEAGPSPAPFERAFRFRHALIQEAAYRSLPKERRADLHERLARRLEGAPAAARGELDEIVGYHLEQAYVWRTELGLADDRSRTQAAEAGARLASAGAGALARNDLPAAVALLTRAAALFEAGGHPRPDVLVDLGAALLPLGDGRKALAVLDKALAEAQAIGDPVLEWLARLERSYVLPHVEPGALSNEDGLRAAERAIEELEPFGDEHALARAWRAVTQFRFWLGRIESSLDASEQALDYARRAGDRQAEVWTLRTRLMALWAGPRPAADAARECKEVLAAAATEEVAACALENLASLRAMQGHFHEALRLVDRATRMYKELGLTMRVAVSLGFHRAEVHALSGDLAAAERDLRSAIELLESIGDRAARATATAFLAGTLYAAGRYSEAEPQAELSHQLLGKDDYASASKLLPVRAKLLARRGDVETAKALMEEAVRVVDATDDLDSRGGVWMDRAEVLRLAGDPEGASCSLELSIELLERKGNIALARRARAQLEELRPGPRPHVRGRRSA